ncbi:hypothetical protein ACYOEI_05465 [Singulisphaera rosea]
MRVPRPTVRRLLATVVVAALIFGVQNLSARRAHFLELAEVHDRSAALDREYRRAAMYPFLSVPPDLPCPARPALVQSAAARVARKTE